MNKLVTVLGLLAALGGGLLAAFGDQRTHTVYLAPEVSNEWKNPPPIDPARNPHASETACQMMQLYPGQCWLFPATHLDPSRVEYQNATIRVLIFASDMNEPDRSRTGYWQGFKQSDLYGKLLLHVFVQGKLRSKGMFDDVSIRCTDKAGQSIEQRVSYRRYVMLRVLPIGATSMPDFPDIETGALLFDKNSDSIEKCTLSFGQLTKNSFDSAKIPDLRLRAVPVAQYRLIF